MTLKEITKYYNKFDFNVISLKNMRPKNSWKEFQNRMMTQQDFDNLNWDEDNNEIAREFLGFYDRNLFALNVDSLREAVKILDEKTEEVRSNASIYSATSASNSLITTGNQTDGIK